MGSKVLWSLAAALVVASSVESVSATASSSTRLIVNLNQGWRFGKGDAPGAEQPGFDDSAWAIVNLPHTVQVEEAVVTRPYQGFCWYRRSLVLSEALKGRKVWLEFEGAMQIAEVWINGGERRLRHVGGYLPFVLDLTEMLRFDGQPNLIAVRLDNRDSAAFPPGKATPEHGFLYEGGLYRDVRLHIADRLHVTEPLMEGPTAGGGVFVTYPRADEREATVRVRTEVRNEHTHACRGCSVRQELLDADGRSVASSVTTFTLPAGGVRTVEQDLRVSRPRLWHPFSPHLYRLLTHVRDGRRLADNLETRIGVRRIHFSKEDGFRINGSRFVFHGCNRHQEWPYVGNAVPDSGQYRDALKIKQAGFDYVRLSHYPQDPAFLDACDELGILVMASTPGWQFFGDAAFGESSLRDIRQMVRWYRNRPSVVLWEASLNESEFPPEWARRAHRIVHDEYPGDQAYSAGWATDEYDVYIGSSQAGVRRYSGPRPAVISEYGDWDYGGRASTSRARRGDGDVRLLRQCENHQESLEANRALPWLTGDGIWVMFDYNEGDLDRELCAAGIMDIFRLPKLSYWFYRSQRDPEPPVPGAASGPFVRLATHWTADSPSRVRVFSNCEKVSLYRDGALVETRRPDAAEGLRHLRHPPFSFDLETFSAGVLRAECLIAGVSRAVHEVRTPQEPRSLSIRIDEGPGLVADGSDLVMIYAEVHDGNGTVVPATTSIHFDVEGPASLVGANPVRTEAGIAAILVQAGTRPGLLRVTARADGLAGGEATLTSRSSTKMAW